MRGPLGSGFAVLVLGFALLGSPSQAGDAVLLTPDEITAVLRHGPWPPPVTPDPSNRVSGSEDAIALGRALFFDTRLSKDGSMSCASCHDPAKGWTDGLDRAAGRARLDRNTQSVMNSRFSRWFGWDGRTDSLWAHSIGPILEPREMGADSAHVAALLADDPVPSALYERAFEMAAETRSPEAVLVDAAKALAAFQETLISPPDPLRRFPGRAKPG